MTDARDGALITNFRDTDNDWAKAMLLPPSVPLFNQQQPRCNEASLMTNTKNQPGTNHHKNQNQEPGLGNEFTISKTC